MRAQQKIVSICDFEKCFNGCLNHLAIKDRNEIEQVLARRAHRIEEQWNARMPSGAEIKMDALEQPIIEVEAGQRMEILCTHIEFLTHALRRRRERPGDMLLQVTVQSLTAGNG